MFGEESLMGYELTLVGLLLRKQIIEHDPKSTLYKRHTKGRERFIRDVFTVRTLIDRIQEHNFCYLEFQVMHSLSG